MTFAASQAPANAPDLALATCFPSGGGRPPFPKPHTNPLEAYSVWIWAGPADRVLAPPPPGDRGLQSVQHRPEAARRGSSGAAHGHEERGSKRRAGLARRQVHVRGPVSNPRLVPCVSAARDRCSLYLAVLRPRCCGCLRCLRPPPRRAGAQTRHALRPCLLRLA